MCISTFGLRRAMCEKPLRMGLGTLLCDSVISPCLCGEYFRERTHHRDTEVPQSHREKPIG
jgi:hypothetical protein